MNWAEYGGGLAGDSNSLLKSNKEGLRGSTFIGTVNESSVSFVLIGLTYWRHADLCFLDQLLLDQCRLSLYLDPNLYLGLPMNLCFEALFCSFLWATSINIPSFYWGSKGWHLQTQSLGQFGYCLKVKLAPRLVLEPFDLELCRAPLQFLSVGSSNEWERGTYSTTSVRWRGSRLSGNTQDQFNQKETNIKNSFKSCAKKKII